MSALGLTEFGDDLCDASVSGLGCLRIIDLSCVLLSPRRCKFVEYLKEPCLGEGGNQLLRDSDLGWCCVQFEFHMDLLAGVKPRCLRCALDSEIRASPPMTPTVVAKR